MFSFLGIGKKKKDKEQDKSKEKDSKKDKKHTSESTRPTSASTAARNKRVKQNQSAEKEKDIEIEVAEIPIPEISSFFGDFFTIYSACDTAKTKRALLSQIKEICPRMVETNTKLTPEKLAAFAFDPVIEKDMLSLLNDVLEESPPRRARLTLALYRFTFVLDQELDDEAFSSGTGVLSGILGNNPNVQKSEPTAVPPCPIAAVPKRLKDESGFVEIDLVKIYFKLLGGLYDGGSKDITTLDPTSCLPEPLETCFILEQVRNIFRREPNVVSVELPAVLVGDIHGQAYDLLYHIIPTGGPLVHHEILTSHKPVKVNVGNVANGGAITVVADDNRKEGGKGLLPPALPDIKGNRRTLPEKYPRFSEPVRYLFLGDYVDRGSRSLHCLLLLCVAKLLDPENVILLRGNHECRLTNKHYGFLEECLKLYPLDKDGLITKLSPQEAKQEVVAVSNIIRDPAEDEFDNNVNNTTSDWDLSEHPFWLKANRAFDCLPLCATLYEVVPPHAEETPKVRRAEDMKAPTTTNNEPNNVSVNQDARPIPVITSEETGDLRPQSSSRHRKRKAAEPTEAPLQKVEEPHQPAVPTGQTTPTPEPDSPSASLVQLVETRTDSDEPNAAPTPAARLPGGSVLEMRSIASSENSSTHCGAVVVASAANQSRNVVRVCAMHGGLSPFIENSIDGIIAVNRFKDIEQGPLADLTWSDPITLKGMDAAVKSDTTAAKNKKPTPIAETESDALLHTPAALLQRGHTLTVLEPNPSPPNYEGPPIGFTFSARGTGHNFGEDVSCLFLLHNHLNFIVRAHQCVQDGYQWVHQRRVLTVFSAPNYCGMGNKGAVLLLDKHGNPRVVQYQFVPKTPAAGSGENAEGDSEVKIPPKEFA
ncbi:Calcineurin-like phosphoesterase, putative [Angomonas deanei]|uniref:Serine/threonine-protein phosphatase n=1 Tax=Angomonas deanei TaxID=59799 RepID=A0A7G2C3Q1_9TRYP|nr:Calcineurin-like phosphoesterase, putative [Angomonas deanei]